ncbi:membrane protein [Clostridioides difficile]|nr:membrane protein [Clostridioides difficile]
MQNFINISLEIFYALMGFLMIVIAYKSFTTISNNKKYGTSLFWILISLPFIFGRLIPANIIGIILILSSLLTLSKQVVFAKYEEPDENFGKEHADKLKNKIFIPSLILAFAAVIVAMSLSNFDNSSQFAIGVGSIIALISALIITKSKPATSVQDGSRLLQQMGPASMLPQLLVALGALFTQAGVGEVISNMISGVVPADNRLFGVISYVLGMVIFTMIMGNAFAAFSVITAGIGIPFVLSQGGNPAIIGALALTAGYCGTLLTPMAANFNIVPAALLECKNDYIVIKYQAPVALVLIIAHILVMYFLGF